MKHKLIELKEIDKSTVLIGDFLSVTDRTIRKSGYRRLGKHYQSTSPSGHLRNTTSQHQNAHSFQLRVDSEPRRSCARLYVS